MTMHVTMILKRSYEELTKDSRVLKEARTLIEQGHQVSICIYGDSNASTQALPFSEIKNCKIPDIPLFSKYNPFNQNINPKTSKNKYFIIFNLILNKLYQTIYFTTTIKILLLDDADVFHVHDYETLLLGLVAAKIKNARLIYDSHELWTESRFFVSRIGKLKKPLVSLIEYVLIKKADVVITVNYSIAKYLSLKYRIKEPFVISNYPELTKIKNNKILRQKLLIDDNSFVVLYQGALFKGRGLEQLLECAEYLQNIIFVIMGDGYLKEELSAKIYKYNLNNVKLIDAVNPTVLLDYVASADIGIAPVENICMSYYLSLPNKIGEFIMAGIPFAVSDFPEMKNLALCEDMGEVFSPNNSKSMINAIEKLMDSNNYQEKKRSILKNKSKFSWENEGIKLKEIYSSMDSYVEKSP